MGLVTGKPPHVLQVFQPEIGGVPRYAESLARGLVERGWRVSVACPAEASVYDDLRAAGVDLLPLEVRRSPNVWQDFRAVRDLAAWCRDRDVSLIHGHSTKAGLLSALAARSAGVPSVYTPHGWAFEMRVTAALRATYALFERQLVHRFHANVLSVSANERAAGERWHVAPQGRIQVVRTGLPAAPAMSRSAARRALGLAQDATVLVWVGRVGVPKRPQDLVPVARAVADDVTVVALCYGLHGTPLAGELRDAGVVLAPPGCEPATVYAAADIMLHTSDWESCPLVVLEAMCARLPVVAYGVGGIPEQIQAGRTGYLVEPGDIEMMCECVLALARNRRVRARMGEAGFQRATKMFSYTSMLEQIIEAYLAAVGPGALNGKGRVTGAWPEAQPHNIAEASGRAGFVDLLSTARLGAFGDGAVF